MKRKEKSKGKPGRKQARKSIADTWPPGIADTWPGIADTWPGIADTWPPGLLAGRPKSVRSPKQ